MLIQDNSEQWKYYSFNGDKIYNSTEGSMGGGPEDNKGERSWSSPQAFLDDSYNQSTSKEDLENGEVNGYGYHPKRLEDLTRTALLCYLQVLHPYSLQLNYIFYLH